METANEAAELRAWSRWAKPGDEIVYGKEPDDKDAETMEVARELAEAGAVALFRKRVEGKLLLIARRVSARAESYLRRAPRAAAQREYLQSHIKRDANGDIPFSCPSYAKV